jgi:hypothetical protein
MAKFEIGDRVQGGKGEDHDTGIVIADDGDEAGTLHDPNNRDGNVLVAWDSGVRTWTPVSLIEAA